MIFGIDDASRAGCSALIDAAREWSYSNLAEEIRKRQQMLGRDKRLGFVFARMNADSIMWYLAALEAGHAIALLDDALASEFKTDLIARYRPEWIAAADATDPQYRFERGLWRRMEPSTEPLHPQLALMLSTSGTTGSPKFVRLTRANVEANAASIVEALAISPDDRAIASLPLHYSYGLSVLNTHLLRGAAFVARGHALTSHEFWSAVRDHRCTSFAGVPYSYHVLRRLDLDALDAPSLRVLTQAGGKLDAPHVEHFDRVMKRRGGKFFVMYGQTEATARICVLPPDELPQRSASVGRAIPGGAIRVIDHELIYEGPNVMMGYASGREDLHKGDELHGLLRTGDVAEIDADGFACITARAGREAKIFGLRLNLDEVEALLKPYGPTAVTAAGDRLLIFCEHGDEAAYARYQRELASRLRLHHRAFSFRNVDKLPVTSSGKIDYRRLSV